MKQRHEELLKLIIEAYTDTAEPIGSKLVAGDLGLSSATLRNEMMELEELGYLHQPHPSAGRVPTEEAYRYYITHWLAPKNVTRREQNEFNSVITKGDNVESTFKNVAKKAAEITGEAVFIAWQPQDLYYTGIANLLSKPEFCRQEEIVSISEVIDGLDESVGKLYNIGVLPTYKILLGRENPLSEKCAVIFTKLPQTENGLMGIFGPMRMDYGRNVGVLEYIKSFNY